MERKIKISKAKEVLLEKALQNVTTNIYQCLQDKNMTLLDLSVKSQLNYNAIWKLLNLPKKNPTGPTTRSLVYIADALDVDVSWLLSNHDNDIK